MSEDSAKTPLLTEAVKTALADQGIIPTLKQSVYSGEKPKDAELQSLKVKAQSAIEEIEKLIGSSNLDQANATKLNTILMRLRGALHSGNVSRDTLAGILSEATTTIASVNESQQANIQSKIEECWHNIEEQTKAINDDFEKMRKAGILFDQKLWEKHERLTQQLQDNPRDIDKQKELNAIDDLLIRQAEPQLEKHPEARESFNDAKKKSEERHQAVDNDLAGFTKSKQNVDAVMSVFAVESQNLTLNDVEYQLVGKKQNSTETKSR